MKMDKKGFTLIELLAVIVILAIIALIATPLIIGVIDKAKKSAAQDSVYGAMESIKLAYTEGLLDTTPTTLPYKATFTNGTIASPTAGLTIGGTKPTSGSITLIADGTYTFENLVVNGYTCTIAAGVVTCE